MKYIIILSVGMAAGIAVGWYVGYTRPAIKYQRELLRKYQPAEFESEMAYIRKKSGEEFNAAAPWERSSASIALAAIEHLDTNDLENTRFRLASIIALYYRGHLRDGDTNLLASITSFAMKDSVLSNAIYGSPRRAIH